MAAGVSLRYIPTLDEVVDRRLWCSVRVRSPNNQSQLVQRCVRSNLPSLAVKATRRLVAEANQDDVSYFAMITQIRESFHDQCAHHLDV